MTRRLAFAVLLVPACTLPNPQFDPNQDDVAESASEGVDETNDAGEQPDTGNEANESSETDPTETAETEDPTDDPTDESSTTEDPISDLPIDPECKVDVGHRIDLGFSSPEALGGNTCADTLTVDGFVVVEGGGYQVMDCGSKCEGECGALHPIALDFDLAPLVGTCVKVEASKPIIEQGQICLWSGLSLFPAESFGSPYFIAVNSVEPTPLALDVLGGWPMLHTTGGMPTIEQQCSCGEVGLVLDCCMPDDEIVTYSLIFNNGEGIAYVGNVGDFILESSMYEYSIYNAMARTYGECASGSIELSWKLWATNVF